MTHTGRFIRKLICISAILGLSFTSVLATEITFPAAEVRAGQPVRIPVIIDKTDNLAGVKLSMTYDKNLLTFQKADKGKAASALMHIVNDKKPGVLIIVMAGARGIKGENFPVLTLYFTAKADITEKKTCRIEVKESQLMSDSLKDTKHKVTVNPLTILPPVSKPDKNSAAKPDSQAESKDKSAAEPPKNAKTDSPSPESETSADEKGSPVSAKIPEADPGETSQDVKKAPLN